MAISRCRLERFYISTPDFYDLCDEDRLSEVIEDGSCIYVICSDELCSHASPTISSKKSRQSFSSSSEEEEELEMVISKFSPQVSEDEADVTTIPVLPLQQDECEEEEESLSVTESIELEDEEFDSQSEVIMHDERLSESTVSLSSSSLKSDKSDAESPDIESHVSQQKAILQEHEDAKGQLSYSSSSEYSLSEDEEVMKEDAEKVEDKSQEKDQDVIQKKDEKEDLKVFEKIQGEDEEKGHDSEVVDDEEDQNSKKDSEDKDENQEQVQGEDKDNAQDDERKEIQSNSQNSTRKEAQSDSQDEEEEAENRFGSSLFTPAAQKPQIWLPLEKQSFKSRQQSSFLFPSPSASTLSEESSSEDEATKSSAADCLKNLPSLSSMFTIGHHNRNASNHKRPVPISGPNISASASLSFKAALKPGLEPMQTVISQQTSRTGPAVVSKEAQANFFAEKSALIANQRGATAMTKQALARNDK